MPETVAIVGLGQLGGLFGEALLRAGHTVIPVRRGESLEVVERAACVLVAVGEDDLDAVLKGLPASSIERVVLVQNELVPSRWRRHGVQTPTCAVVWFERKGGGAPKVIRSTPVAGPCASLLVEALRGVGVLSEVIETAALDAALVKKNLYILVSNAAGLVVGGTTGALATQHRALVTELALELLGVQRALLGHEVAQADELLADLFDALAADPEHACAGRSAPRRVERARADAARVGVPTPRLDLLAPVRA